MYCVRAPSIVIMTSNFSAILICEQNVITKTNAAVMTLKVLVEYLCHLLSKIFDNLEGLLVYC